MDAVVQEALTGPRSITGDGRLTTLSKNPRTVFEFNNELNARTNYQHRCIEESSTHDFVDTAIAGEASEPCGKSRGGLADLAFTEVGVDTVG
jgi:hypothetical protein